ncbi:hypothetical protein BT96DRAFT_1007937 [Gymnopus androsaceus JB14]|uniref:Uncharacterized protein n=1 Tax=Gymnopus androsaceus JB14 TaxID=1447944 RepID=A0A6A4GGF7_9AGAR|nr:hypothetical protein BT96DRAFT_1007937 [Gymnopus androsaceus JB14]
MFSSIAAVIPTLPVPCETQYHLTAHSLAFHRTPAHAFYVPEDLISLYWQHLRVSSLVIIKLPPSFDPKVTVLVLHLALPSSAQLPPPIQTQVDAIIHFLKQQAIAIVVNLFI